MHGHAGCAARRESRNDQEELVALEAITLARKILV
jgi:hypothetical protein